LLHAKRDRLSSRDRLDLEVNNIFAHAQQHASHRGLVVAAEQVHGPVLRAHPVDGMARAAYNAREKEKTMQVAASIFKAYDIRGIVGQTIDETFAEHLGRAFGSEAVKAGEKAVAVGRDGRLSGPGLVKALVKGLASTGLDVVDIGAVTTPMLYYVAATRARHGCRSGIQVTGSHNPKDYNGFKMVLGGRAIYGPDIQRLRQRIEAEDYVKARGRRAPS
jgi:phosphomannomutase